MCSRRHTAHRRSGLRFPPAGPFGVDACCTGLVHPHMDLGSSPSEPLPAPAPDLTSGALTVNSRSVGPAVSVSLCLGVATYIPDFLAPRLITWITVSAFSVLFGWILLRHRRVVNRPLVSLALLVYFLVELAGAVRYGTGLDYAETLLTLSLVTSLTAVVSTFDAQDIRQLFTGVIIVCGIQLAFAVAETFLRLPAPRGYGTRSGSTFDTNVLLPWTGRAPGTFGHAIPLGMYLMVALLLVAFQMRSWRRWLRAVLVAAFAFGILLSGTRSALLSGFLALVVGLCSKELTKKHLAWRLTACIAALVFGAFVGISELLATLGLQDTGSLNHRLAAIDALDKLYGRSVPELLFGSGAGSVPHLFELGLLQTDNFTAIDNQLVTLFAVGGIVGTAAVIRAVVSGYRRVPSGTRPAVLAMVFMFFSFDEFDRLSTLILFVTVLACGSQGRWRGADIADDSLAGSSPGQALVLGDRVGPARGST